MEFKEANKKLKEVSQGEYRSLRFELTTFADGRTTTACQIYVNPSLSGRGSTWAEAFEKLDKEMNPGSHIEETPDVDDGDPIDWDAMISDVRELRKAQTEPDGYEQEQFRQERISEVRADDRVMESHLNLKEEDNHDSQPTR